MSEPSSNGVSAGIAGAVIGGAAMCIAAALTVPRLKSTPFGHIK